MPKRQWSTASIEKTNVTAVRSLRDTAVTRGMLPTLVGDSSSRIGPRA